MSRLERAQAVLDALGQPALRPQPTPRGVKQVLCKRGCNAQIIIAPLASGQWAPLDRAPAGHMVIVNGIVRERGPQHGPDIPAYSFHRCNPKEKST